MNLKENWPKINGRKAKIYVISPFKKVASKIQKIVQDEIQVEAEIGTVHTFQGKEAEVVFLVLGSAPGDEGLGSRRWASQKPNLLNVALTRAKFRIYVIGNRNDWGSMPYFKVMEKILENKVLQLADKEVCYEKNSFSQ